MSSHHFLLIVLDIAALAAALWVTSTSLAAYRDGNNTTYLMAFLGFGLLTLGVASEAVLFRVGSLGITTVHTIETLLFMAGFGFLYLSLK